MVYETLLQQTKYGHIAPLISGLLHSSRMTYICIIADNKKSPEPSSEGLNISVNPSIQKPL